MLSISKDDLQFPVPHSSLNLQIISSASFSKILNIFQSVFTRHVAVLYYEVITVQQAPPLPERSS